MKIDYFCFSIPNLGSSDYTIDQKDDENIIWIKAKEVELMKLANENNMLIVYDRKTKKFYNGFVEIDIKDKIIFPRSFIPYERELLNQIEICGAIPIQTTSDLDKIENWPQTIQPVHRRVIQTTYGDFQLNNQKYKNVFKNVFIKTAKKTSNHCVLKYYGNIDVNGERYFVTKPTLWNISSNDSIFLSEAFCNIDDKENNMDCKEYRAFVLDGSLLSISRSYIDYPTEVSNDVIEFVKQQIDKVSSIPYFPNSYVLDVGQVLIDGKEVIDIIEYNSISSSGLEVCNLLINELLKQRDSSQKTFKKVKPIK